MVASSSIDVNIFLRSRIGEAGRRMAARGLEMYFYDLLLLLSLFIYYFSFLCLLFCSQLKTIDMCCTSFDVHVNCQQ